MSKLSELIRQLNDSKKIFFNLNVKNFYKHDMFPDEVLINKEVMIQLNITPKCLLSCSFCYIKHRFENLKKHYKELSLTCRINLTGRDIFYYYKIEELSRFLNSADFIVAEDPLINRI